MRCAIASLFLFVTALAALPAEDVSQRLKVLRQAYQAALDREQGVVHQAYKAELAKMKEAFASAGDLDSAVVVQAEIDGRESGRKPPRLVTAKENYNRALERVANSLKPAYSRALVELKSELTKAGNLTEAVAVDAELKAQAATAAPVQAGPAPIPGVPGNALIIETLIDGPSELRVQKDTMYWMNDSNSKPGRHNGKKEPTYVNGAAWQPEWGTPGDRGTDTSKPYPLPVRFDSVRLDFKLISVSSRRGEAGIEQRDPIKAKGVGSDYSVLIPDTLSGSRWYKFALYPKGSR